VTLFDYISAHPLYFLGWLLVIWIMILFVVGLVKSEGGGSAGEAGVEKGTPPGGDIELQHLGLPEIIERCREFAAECGNSTCSRNHTKLAELLEELAKRREEQNTPSNGGRRT
jgi:hypothetical protein